MRRSIVLIIVVLVFCSPLVSSAYAGQIQAKELSQTETDNMTTLEIDSATLIGLIEGGETDAGTSLLAGFGLVVILLGGLAASAA
jgi:hypothetical protein